MQNHIPELSTLFSSISALLAIAPPINNAHSVIKNTSDDAKPENAAVWQREPRPGDKFSGIEEAMEFIQEHAHNPAKNRCNDEEGYRWSDLPELHREIKPVLKLARVTINQEYVNNSDGVPSIKTTFTHVPTLTTKVFWMTTNLKGIRKNQQLDECQQMGWTITYCRRYALYAALDLQPDDMGDMDGTSRRKGRAPAQPDALHDECQSWLPDVTMPGWEEAERRAVAMGATPYTPEQIEAAKDQKREFSKLTQEEIAILNNVCNPLEGDYRGITPVYKKYETELFRRINAGDICILDEEDLRRGIHRCWLLASQEFTGIEVSLLCDDDADDVAIVPDSNCNPPSDDADDELQRLQACRASLKESLRNGTVSNTSGDPAADAEGDAAYAKLNEKRVKKDTPTPDTKPLVDIPESDLPY